MSPSFERSAGVIPFRIAEDGMPLYLVLHSATVRNPRARWEFPKGGMDPGETARQTAAREFQDIRATVEIDGRPAWTGFLTAAVVANGPFYGGGMKIAPDAAADDGILDIVIVGALGRAELLAWWAEQPESSDA